MVPDVELTPLVYPHPDPLTPILIIRHPLSTSSIYYEGPRPRGRPKRTWREVVREDCQACKMNKEDAMDRYKWRKMIKDVR